MHIFSYFIEPFMPALTAKIHYLLGCPNECHNGIYLTLNNMKAAILTSLNNSNGLK